MIVWFPHCKLAIINDRLPSSSLLIVHKAHKLAHIVALVTWFLPKFQINVFNIIMGSETSFVFYFRRFMIKRLFIEILDYGFLKLVIRYVSNLVIILLNEVLHWSQACVNLRLLLSPFWFYDFGSSVKGLDLYLPLDFFQFIMFLWE